MVRAQSDLQVYAGVVAALQVMLETSSTFTKACIALSAPPLSDKLGDIKLKKSCGDLLLSYAEKSSLQFVLSQGALGLSFVLIAQLTTLSSSRRRPRRRRTRSPGSTRRSSSSASLGSQSES